jgi:hypothetical protein
MFNCICKSLLKIVKIECPGRFIGGSVNKHATETILLHCDNCGKDLIFHDVHKPINEACQEMSHVH